jgi:hypothetical protein
MTRSSSAICMMPTALHFDPNDTIDLGEGIDSYFVSQEEVTDWVRIATVDFDYTADLVQGSIVLAGVTLDEWTSWVVPRSVITA